MSPFPNEHSCRLKSPDEFQPKSFRRMTENQPKGQSLIIARPKGKTTTAAQSIRYDKAIWTEEKAKASCADKGGTFEPASSEAAEAEKYPEASWQDVVALVEAKLSFNEKQDLIQKALREHLGFWEGKYGPWIRDVWEDRVIFEGGDDGKYWEATYTIDDKGKVAIGESKEVLRQTVWVDVAKTLEEASTIKAQIQGFLQTNRTMI